MSGQAERFLGIDIGSTSTVGVIMDTDETILAKAIVDTHPRHLVGVEAMMKSLRRQLVGKDNRAEDDIRITYCVGTGYGRKNIPQADEMVTEISCHARGAAYLFPGANSVIDIGGQDSKVLRIGPRGEVLDFVMNEKCAAGTGRFLEILSSILEVDISEIGEFSQKTTQEAEISSMCAVFAETEVVSRLAEEVPEESVVRGVHASIAYRILAMARRIKAQPPFVFTGGVARNTGMVAILKEKAELGDDELLVSGDGQLAGAIGAALLAIKSHGMKKLDDQGSNRRFHRKLFDYREDFRRLKKSQPLPIIAWIDFSVPVELITAGKLAETRLRGDLESDTSRGSQFVSTYSCEFVKNAVSSLLARNPKYRKIKGLIATNMCTATEQMDELLNFRPVLEGKFQHFLNIPRNNDAAGITFLKNKLPELKRALETHFDLTISEEAIRENCTRYNRFKRRIHDYTAILNSKHAPDTGSLVALVMEKYWASNKLGDDILALLEEEIREAEELPVYEKIGPNVMLSGSIIPDPEFYNLFGELNCQLVYNHTSSGNKFAEALVDTDRQDIYEALAERCLFPGYSPRMINMKFRLDHFERLITEHQVEAIVYNISKFCVYYNFEAVLLKQFCEERNIPLLVLESDFSNKGFGQLKTRIEAFLEVVRSSETGLKT